MTGVTMSSSAQQWRGPSPLSSPTAASVDRAKESRERAMSSRPWKCWAMWSLHTEQMLWMAFAAADAKGFSRSPFIR